MIFGSQILPFWHQNLWQFVLGVKCRSQGLAFSHQLKKDKYLLQYYVWSIITKKVFNCDLNMIHKLYTFFHCFFLQKLPLLSIFDCLNLLAWYPGKKSFRYHLTLLHLFRSIRLLLYPKKLKSNLHSNKSKCWLDWSPKLLELN